MLVSSSAGSASARLLSQPPSRWLQGCWLVSAGLGRRRQAGRRFDGWFCIDLKTYHIQPAYRRRKYRISYPSVRVLNPCFAPLAFFPRHYRDRTYTVLCLPGVRRRCTCRHSAGRLVHFHWPWRRQAGRRFDGGFALSRRRSSSSLLYAGASIAFPTVSPSAKS